MSDKPQDELTVLLALQTQLTKTETTVERLYNTVIGEGGKESLVIRLVMVETALAAIQGEVEKTTVTAEKNGRRLDVLVNRAIGFGLAVGIGSSLAGNFIINLFTP